MFSILNLNLPLEIDDLVILSSAYISNANLEMSKIVHYVEHKGEHKDTCGCGCQLRGEEIRNEIYYKRRSKLAVLRHITKAFCESASPRLFRHIATIMNPCTAHYLLTKLIRLSDSSLAVHVRRISLTLHVDRARRGRGRLDTDRVSFRMTEVSSCLATFPNFNYLELDLKRADCGYWENTDSRDITEQSFRCYNKSRPD